MLTKTKLLSLLFLLVSQTHVWSQSLDLFTVYELAKNNYPLLKQRALIQKSKAYTVDNLSKAYLPQIQVNGQATYQSAVTSIPIFMAGVAVPTLSKDQYKIYAEISQSLYDGGVTKHQQLSAESNALVDEQRLEVELYQLKERLNQLFFGILLLDEQLRQMALLQSDIEAGIKRAEGAVANGTALKSSVDVLKAELLKTRQKVTELQTNRRAYVEILALFINRSPESITLIRPSVPKLSQTITRPEMLLFDNQVKSVVIQEQALSGRSRPRLSMFIQGGYGRPTLDMLNNAFGPYYIGGVRLSWSISGLYTVNKEKAILGITQQRVEVQRETFLFNTGFSLKQQDADILKYTELLRTDDEIIALRTNIKQAAAAQFENGVINSQDYLRELNAENLARETKSQHEIQLLMSQYNHQTITGN